jgi:hypothetical protein
MKDLRWSASRDQRERFPIEDPCTKRALLLVLSSSKRCFRDSPSVLGP